MTPDPPASFCSVCQSPLVETALGPQCQVCLFALMAEDDPVPEEARVFGGYELMEELGRGGMGVVYRAWQPALHRQVALKMLLAGPFASPEFASRFRLEAQAAARLRHPGIAAIYDVGECDGQPFYTMELVEGRTLAALARETLPAARESAAILEKTARAVAHAHGQGVLHRDLKPSNIILDRENNPKVADFGLARLIEGGRDSGATLTTNLLGSPPYMAPEQAAGDPATPATDVYALGAVLYELLTGRPPHQGSNPREILVHVREAAIVDPRRLNPSLSRDLETVCLKCLERDPVRRYGNAAELAEDLGRFLRGEPVKGRPVSAVEKGWRWCRRRPAVAGLLGALGAGAVVAFWQIDAARRNESAAAAHAETVSHKLRETNARLEETVDSVELQRAEDLFRAGESAHALGHLARVLHRNPAHRAASARLASALWHGPFARPAGVPLPIVKKISFGALLPGGETVLVGDNTRPLAVHDVRTGRERFVFAHEGQVIPTMVVSGDGSRAVAWAFDTVWLWDTATGRYAAPPRSAGLTVFFAALSPDGSRLWIGGDGEIRSVEATSTQAPQPFRNITGICECLAASPDGALLAVAMRGLGVQCFATGDGRPAGPLVPHPKRVAHLAFSPDSTRLALAGDDNEARLIDWRTGVPSAPALVHGDYVSFVVFSADGRRVATTSGDNTARVWDAMTGRPVTQPLRHSEQPTMAGFSDDGSWLCTGGSEGLLRRWELRTAEARPRPLAHTAVVAAVAFSPQGSRIATASEDGQLSLWNTSTGEKLATVGVRPEALRRLAFAPTGTPLACIADSGVSVRAVADGPALNEQAFFPADAARAAAWSSDGRRLAIGQNDGTVRLWDVAARTSGPGLPHDGPICQLSFSRDGSMLLAGVEHFGSGAHLWRLNDGRPAVPRMAEGEGLYAAALSPDGKWIATASRMNRARVWDAATGLAVSPPLLHARSVVALDFSPDSRWLVTASWDATAQVWDCRTGTKLGPPLGHAGRVNDVHFSPDGRRIATASSDGTVRLWDASTGLPISEPLRHETEVRTLQFSPDGQSLVSVSGSSAASLWSVPDFQAPAPGWSVQAAEALAGKGDADAGSVISPFIQWPAAARAAKSSPGDAAWEGLAKRLFGE